MTSEEVERLKEFHGELTEKFRDILNFYNGVCVIIFCILEVFFILCS